MKTYSLIVLLLVFSQLLKAQTGDSTKTKSSKVNMKIITEQEAHYQGTDYEFAMYFFENMEYSEEALKNRISGEVMLSFDVLQDSTISDVRVLGSLGYGIDEEVVRLLKNLKYAPRIQNGIPVKANMIITIPIRAVARKN